MLLLLVFGSLPIPVLAETATYLSIGDICWHGVYGSNPNLVTYYSTGNTNDVRAIILKDQNSDNCDLYFISLATFKYDRGTQNGGFTSCPVPNRIASSVAYEGTTYYFGLQSTAVSQNWYKLWIDNNVPEAIYNNVPDSNERIKLAIRYTFGDLSVEPIEPINWGKLKDVKYETAIAGSGSASVRNIDYIHWEPSVDAWGNDISENSVEIQAVPGKWTGSDLQTLMQKVNSDLDSGSYGPVSLGTVNASVGTFSISWQHILDELGWKFDSMFAHLEDEVFLKQGWYYQIRMTAPDGYIGSWQTVYTALSGSAQGSETILNSTTYNTDLYQYMQNLSVINNQTNTNITINGTIYNVENPNNGTEPEGGTNLWDLLKALLSGLFQIMEKLGDIAIAIIEAIGGIVQSLIDGILDLFRFDSFEVPDFETQTQTIRENTGIIGEALDFETDLQEAINDVVSDHSDAEPVFSTSGIELMGVQVIPAMNINLNDYVDSLEQAGWSNVHSYIYLMTDGIVWISLIGLILRKLNEVLKK